VFAESGCRIALGKIDPKHYLQGGILPAKQRPEDYARDFLRVFGVKGIDGETVHTLPGEIPIAITKDIFRTEKGGFNFGVNIGRGRYAQMMAETIKSPYEIWSAPVEVNGRRKQALNLFRMFSGNDGAIPGAVVFSLIGKQWTGNSFGTLTSAAEKYIESKRKGVLVYREEK
jgi:hypothetical protein